MNRKKKIIYIIISFIILVSIIGFTFAYIGTRILGNSNSKKMSFTSKKVSVTYKEISNTSSGETISPGYQYLKVFTATNTGNVEVKYHIYLDEVINSFVRTQDIVYTLYRKSGNNTININSLNEADIVTTGVLPTSNSYIMVNELISIPKDSYTYALKVDYLTSSENQDVDDGNSFGFKVQLSTDIKNLFDTNTLAYSILDNSLNKKNNTEFLTVPNTKVGSQPSYSSYYTDRVNEGVVRTMAAIPVTYQNYYWTYGTGYTINESTGRFTLTGVSTCKYNDGTCNSTLVGKYLVSPYYNYNSSSTDTVKKTADIPFIYKVESAENSSTTSSVKLTFKTFTPVSKESENVLSMDYDDYGISYYYRGNVKDNYLDFANKCWRIVRIQGDGSIKLILEDNNNTCKNSTGNWTWASGPFGYIDYAVGELTASDGTTNSKATRIVDYLNPKVNASISMSTRFESYQSTLGSSANNFLKSGGWCFDNGVYVDINTSSNYVVDTQDVLDKKIKGINFRFTPWHKLQNYSNAKKSFKCTGTKLNKFSDATDMYVGTLTADEVMHAGGSTKSNLNYYLINEMQKNSGTTVFWTLSLSSFFYNNDLPFEVEPSGQIADIYATNHRELRPSVILLSNTLISGGDGTKSNPYILRD